MKNSTSPPSTMAGSSLAMHSTGRATANERRDEAIPGRNRGRSRKVPARPGQKAQDRGRRQRAAAKFSLTVQARLGVSEPDWQCHLPRIRRAALATRSEERRVGEGGKY